MCAYMCVGIHKHGKQGAACMCTDRESMRCPSNTFSVLDWFSSFCMLLLAYFTCTCLGTGIDARMHISI